MSALPLPYGATVLDHFRRPRNSRPLPEANVRAEGHNPLCGDRVRVELLVDQGTVRSAAFTANACALCTAAASLLTEHAMGATVARVAAFSDDDALAWLETTVPSGREACATLPLRALRQVLDRQLQPAPRA